MKLNQAQLKRLKTLHDDVDNNWPLRKGKNEYLAFLKGGEVGRAGTMLAMCYVCMYGYDGGPEDCQGVSCPMYPYFPYRTERSRKEYTPEQREAMLDRVAKMQAARRTKNEVHE